MEYSYAVTELQPRLTGYLQTETLRRPAITFHLSTDRIGSGKNTLGYFLTVAKNIPRAPVSPYVSLSYSEASRRFLYPFGVNIDINRNWSFLPMYDGQRSHLVLTYRQKDFSVSLMSIWLQRPGISISFGF